MLKPTLFNDVLTIHNNFDRLVDRLFEKNEIPAMRAIAPVEAFVDKSQLTVRVFVPGVDEKSLVLTQLDDSLVIQGEYALIEKKEGVRMLLQETPVGKFERRIVLPEDVLTDREKCTAKLDKGVLEITMPVVSQYLQKRQVPISISDTKQVTA